MEKYIDVTIVKYQIFICCCYFIYYNKKIIVSTKYTFIYEMLNIKFKYKVYKFNNFYNSLKINLKLFKNSFKFWYFS